ncbi:MAG: hypothetical protein CME59_13495 [Halioglobus sp.]|nr:hypothetical protein [Halioglobus sp.]|tara:strand:+ start:583 stop:1524 length:942 start_codon:yes stop_codon:yes gene_type:complete
MLSGQTYKRCIFFVIAMLGSWQASAAILSGTVSDPLVVEEKYRLQSEFNGANPDGLSTIFNRVSGTPQDDDVYVEWRAGTLFTVTMKCCDFQGWQSSQQTYRVPQNGGIGDAKSFGIVTGAQGFGDSEFFEPGIADQRLNDLLDDLLDVPGDIIQIVADLSGSPTRLRLTSQVEKISETEYEYRNFAENFTEYAIPFEWQAAGLAGTLDPLDAASNLPGVVSSSMRSSSAPTEITGSVSALLTLGMKEVCDFNDQNDFVCVLVPNSGNQFMLAANVFTPRSTPPTPGPIPVPATLWLVALSFAGLRAAQRSRN